MARPPGSVYRKLVTALLILCGAASSVIIGSMLHRDGRLNIPFFAGAAGAVKPPVRVIYVTEFLDCGDELRETESISPDDLPVLLETLSPDWTVAKNTEGEVRLWRGVPGYCGTHHRQRLIALYRGHICVFRGERRTPISSCRSTTTYVKSTSFPQTGVPQEWQGDRCRRAAPEERPGCRRSSR